MVNQIFYYNTNKFPAIAQDYSDTKARAEKLTNQKTTDTNIFTALFEATPQGRRAVSLQDKINNGNYLAAAAVAGYTVVNAKEDIRDLISAVKQIYSKINPNFHYDPLYNRNTHQHAFSGIRGMIGEETLFKAYNKGNPFAQTIDGLDKTIDKTKVGEWITKVFKVKTEYMRKIDKIRDFKGRYAYAYKFKSSVIGGKTMARAMKRTTLLGVAVMGAIELPAIISATVKGDNFFEHVENGAKQTLKSATNVVVTTAGIGILGAIGAQHMGATGSLIGMGLGAITANRVSNKLQNAIC